MSERIISLFQLKFVNVDTEPRERERIRNGVNGRTGDAGILAVARMPGCAPPPDPRRLDLPPTVAPAIERQTTNIGFNSFSKCAFTVSLFVRQKASGSRKAAVCMNSSENLLGE
jgi:hypothetical protein